MWVKQALYIALREKCSAQSATIEWLRQDANKLNEELAILKAKILGIPPLRVPYISAAEPLMNVGGKPPRDTDDSEGPSLEDLVKGNVSMEDMGDAAAAKAGVDWDPESGQVRYN